MDELERHERVIGQLEHGQTANRGLSDATDLGVPESGAEGERALQVRDPEPKVAECA
ncbi:MAG: hypothetical protein ACR2FE_07045 [Aeromicrobium sp.]